MNARTPALTLALALALTPATALAQRINHAGRILGPAPAPLGAPILFNTAQADAVMSALQIMPTTNAINEDVSGRPLHGSTTTIMGQISTDLMASRRSLIAFEEMNFVLVPDGQATQMMLMTNYPDESDDTNLATGIATYAFPNNLPLEGWPSQAGGASVTAFQTMCGGDCHSIVLMPALGRFWETWQTSRVPASTPPWEAANLARFDIGSNALRPDGWTSGDAAGLPMLPLLVRYDECQRGLIEHAVRIIVVRSRNQHVYPATHDAGSNNASLPAMGERLRLRSTFTAPAVFTTCERALVTSLQTYGAIVADNGNFFSISVTPDDRYAANEFSHLGMIPVSAFDVVQGTGATQGPRAPGAPTCNAGPDTSATVGMPITLTGAATGTGITTTWYVYPYATAPGGLAFGTPMALTTTATFAAVGDYVVMLRASDGTHANAYDAVTVHVTASGVDAGSGGTDAGTDAGRDGGTDAAVVMTDAGSDAAVVSMMDTGPGNDAFVDVDAASGTDATSGVDAASGVDVGTRPDTGADSAARADAARADGSAMGDAGSAAIAGGCACGVRPRAGGSGAAVVLAGIAIAIGRRRSRPFRRPR